MTEQVVSNLPSPRIPGLDAEATPFLSVGLGLTGLALGLRPRLAPVPLALTALTALLYRDPERHTPDDTSVIFRLRMGLCWILMRSMSIASCIPMVCGLRPSSRRLTCR